MHRSIHMIMATFAASLLAFPAFAQDSAKPAAPAAQQAKTLPNGQAIQECLSPVEGMSCIPGGAFLRGYDNDKHHCNQSSYNKAYVSKEMKEKKDYRNNFPQETVWMQTFYMDKTEVTNAAYKECVKEKKCEKDGPKYVDFDASKQPITGLSWYNAKKFCEAQGKHLPTEAEWEKAARGENGDIYPWGNEPVSSCDNAVIMSKEGRSCGEKKRRGVSPEKGRVLEVCSKGASRYGLCDMMGNAEEWVADWYTGSYEACGDDCRGIDPKGPCGGNEDADGRCGKYRHKSVRGGSWYWEPDHATGIHRRSHVPSNNPAHHFGFRCAASQEEMQKLLNK